MQEASSRKYKVFAVAGEASEVIYLGAKLVRSKELGKAAEGTSFLATDGLKIFLLGDCEKTVKGAKESTTGVGSSMTLDKKTLPDLLAYLTEMGYAIDADIVNQAVESMTLKPNQVEDYKYKQAIKKVEPEFEKVAIPALSKKDIPIDTFISMLETVKKSILADNPKAVISVGIEFTDVEDFVDNYNIQIPPPADEDSDEFDDLVEALEDQGYDVIDESFINVYYLKY